MKQYEMISQVIFDTLENKFLEQPVDILNDISTELAKEIDSLYEQTKIIEYYTREVYGNKLIYIKNKEYANLLYNLTNKKTISKNDIFALEKLGFKLKQVIN